MDSEFGLVFYSYLSIGTLNLKIPPAALPGLCYTVRRPCPSSQRTALSVRGFAYTAADLALRRKGRLSVLMICFRWVRSKPFALRRKVWLNPAYVVINNKPVIL